MVNISIIGIGTYIRTIDGTPYAVKAARTVWTYTKSGRIVRDGEKDETAPIVQNAALRRAGNILYADFSISEDIDFSQEKADVVISYFTKGEDEKLTAIYNYDANTNGPLVKDKTWDAYLVAHVGGTKYCKGKVNNNNAVDLLPANTIVGTQLNPNSSYLKNGDEAVINLNEQTIVVKIIVTDNAGNESAVKVLEYTAN